MSLVCVCAYVCTLALTQTQEQTCLSEAAAKPGWGVKAAARAGKEVWVACCKREPKVIFHDVAEEINIYHRLALSLGRCAEDRETSALLPLPRCLCPFIFSSRSDTLLRDAGHPESPWATRTAPRTTRWVQEASLPPAVQLS